ncbi:hypothetical protein CPC08DRAFT_709726 [Agrocybe pediades]|nr:hypothetical protein CPC08DRAFT_709726 [Agrocybe pediades]
MTSAQHSPVPGMPLTGLLGGLTSILIPSEPSTKLTDPFTVPDVSTSTPLHSTGTHSAGFQSMTITKSATSSESLPASSSSQLQPSNSSAIIHTAPPPVQANQGSPTSHRLIVSIMIPVLITTLSLVAIIVMVIMMIRRRRRRGFKNVDGASQVMPYNLRRRKDYGPAGGASLKQELKEARETAHIMSVDGQVRQPADQRIPKIGGLIEDIETGDRMVVSGRDGDGEVPEQDAASGSHVPTVVAMRLDEIERRMRSLETTDVTQNQIGANIASAEMLATIQRLLVEMNRPPPEYSSALQEGNNA